MAVLSLHNLQTSDHLTCPSDFSETNLRSPALDVFTDFRQHEPLVVDAWAAAVEAAEFMRRTHTHLRLVVDPAGCFIGTITLDDLTEQRLLKAVANGEARARLRVSDLMVHRPQLRALAYPDLHRATVGDVVDTLRHHGERHCLVVNPPTHRIRGVIAASDIARRLHRQVDVPACPSFAEVFAAIHG